jgi:cytochrome P450
VALPPGPSWPPLVQGLGFWTRPLAFLEGCRERYGRRFTLRLPGAPTWVVHSDPEHLKQIYTAPPDVLHPGQGARVLEPVVGLNSVILLDEDAHMEQRKLLLPALHGERMERLSGLIEELTEREIASWPRDVPVRLHERFQGLTLEVILRTVFGLEEGERLDALRDLLAAQLAFGDKPISLLPPAPESERLRAVLSRVGPFVSFVRLQERSDELLYALIEERRRDHADRDDILSMLVDTRHEDGTPMSDEEIRDELMTLLVAGHETTASTLAWALEILVRHPEVLERLREEAAAGEEEYLTATIQETMRRRPVIPNAGVRFVHEPIEVGGWEYQPGVALMASAYLLHHDPDVYPDPYAFRPERFLGRKPGTYTWVPFGGGRRRCLGAAFAMTEMRIVLRALAAACEVAPVVAAPEPPKRRNITIKPGAGALVVLRDRVREPRAQVTAAA